VDRENRKQAKRKVYGPSCTDRRQKKGKLFDGVEKENCIAVAKKKQRKKTAKMEGGCRAAALYLRRSKPAGPGRPHEGGKDRNATDRHTGERGTKIPRIISRSVSCCFKDGFGGGM